MEKTGANKRYVVSVKPVLMSTVSIDGTLTYSRILMQMFMCKAMLINIAHGHTHAYRFIKWKCNAQTLCSGATFGFSEVRN